MFYPHGGSEKIEVKVALNTQGHGENTNSDFKHMKPHGGSEKTKVKVTFVLISFIPLSWNKILL